MAKLLDTPSADVIGMDNDDTIELQLSESALQALQEAAAAAQAGAADPMVAANDPEARPAEPEDLRSPAFGEQPPLHRAPQKSGPRSTVVFSVVAVAAVLLSGVTYLAKSRTRPPVRVAAASVPAPTVTEAPVVPPQAEEPAPVRFPNPFDKTEVFEFPAGTSDIEARDTVAEVLAQRALERQVQLRKLPRRISRTADRNTPVTITKLTPQS